MITKELIRALESALHYWKTVVITTSVIKETDKIKEALNEVKRLEKLLEKYKGGGKCM